MSNELTKHASDVQSWLEQNRNVKPVDTVGQGVIQDLQKWLSAGKIDLEPTNEKYFQILENQFPISVNRVDWSKVYSHRNIQLCRSRERGENGLERQLALENVRGTLVSWLGDLGISKNDFVVYIGDDSDIALKMTIETFLECFPILLVQPQHGYVLPVDGSWCLNYTMESELFLGRSSDAVAKGWIDE